MNELARNFRINTGTTPALLLHALNSAETKEHLGLEGSLDLAEVLSSIAVSSLLSPFVSSGFC